MLSPNLSGGAGTGGGRGTRSREICRKDVARVAPAFLRVAVVTQELGQTFLVV